MLGYKMDLPIYVSFAGLAKLGNPQGNSLPELVSTKFLLTKKQGISI